MQEERKGQHLLLVLHGGRLDEDPIRQAIDELRTAGHKVTVRLTFEPGDAEAFIAEALSSAAAPPRDADHAGESAAEEGGGPKSGGGGCPFDTIVAGGGDGTLNEVVGAMLKHNAPESVALAQLPLGTANDLASIAGISLVPSEALALAADPSNVQPIDVALVNGQVFMNIATAGPVSEVESAKLSPWLKKALGPLSMFVAGAHTAAVQGVAPKEGLTLTFPLEEGATPDNGRRGQVHGDLLALAAGQGRQMGRALNCCPDALLDDGALDFTLMWGRPQEHFARITRELLDRGVEGAGSGVKVMRAPWLLVEGRDPVKVNRDGEPSEPSNRLLFEVLPRKVRMHLPPSAAPLLLAQHAPTERDAHARVVPPTAATSSSRMTGKRGRRVGRGLLSQLFRAKQPPGRGAKRRAHALRVGRRLGKVAVLVAVGYGLGMWQCGL